MRKYLLLIAVIFLTFLQAKSQSINFIYQNLAIQYDFIENLNTCTPQQFTASITNTSAADIGNVKVSFQNADGKITYQLDQITQPGVTVDIPTTSITIANILAGETVIIQVPYIANCSNISTTSSASVSSVSHVLVNDDPITDKLINYQITSGYLSFDQANMQNDNYTGHKGDNFTRVFPFRNTSNNLLNGYLYYEELLSPNITINNLTIRIGSGSTQTVVTNPIIQSGKVIQVIPLTNIPANTDVIIGENVTVSGCPNSNTGKVSLKFGCSNNFCTDYTPQPLNMEIHQGVERPYLTFIDLNNNGQNLQSKCLSNNTLSRKYKIINTGNAVSSSAMNLQGMDFSNPTMINLYLIDNSTFSFSYFRSDGTQYPSAAFDVIDDETLSMSELIQYYNNTSINYQCNFPSNTRFVKLKNFQVNNMNPGDYVIIEYTETSCCSDQGIYGGYKLYQPLIYTDVRWDCYSENGPNNAPQQFVVSNMNFFQFQGVTDIFGCTNNCNDFSVLTNDYTEDFSLKISDFILLKDQPFSDLGSNDYVNISFDLAVDGNLMLAPVSGNHGNITLFHSVTGQTLSPVSVQSLTSGDITAKFGTTTLPVSPDNYMGTRVVFSIPVPSSSNYQERFRLLSALINTYELRFQVSAVCGRVSSSTGASNYYVKSYFGMDPSCLDCNLPVGQRSKSVRVNCPGCQYPGVITTSYQIARKTYGFKDTDNNGIPDTGMPLADETTANIYSKVMTENDVFSATTTAALWSGGFKTYGKNGVPGTMETTPGFTQGFLTNIARLDRIVSFGNFFDVLVSSQYPITLHYNRNGAPLFTVTFTNNNDNIYSSNGTGDFLFQFNRDLIRQKTGDNSFVIMAEDSYDIIVHYKVKEDYTFPEGVFYDNVDIVTNGFMSGNDLKDLSKAEGDPQSPYGSVGLLSQTDISLIQPSSNFMCEAFGGTLVLADQKKKFYLYGPSRPGNCIQTISAAFCLNGSSLDNWRRNDNIGKDLFPFEVRNLTAASKFWMIIPKGFQYSGGTFYSSSSYRRDTELDYVINVWKIPIASNQVQLITPNFVDPVNPADGIQGDLYEITYPLNSPSIYPSAVPPHTNYSTYENLGMLPYTNTLYSYNEYTEQVVSIEIEPICSSPDLPNGIVAIMDNPDAAWRGGAMANGVVRFVTISPNGDLVKYDQQTDSYNLSNLSSIRPSVGTNASVRPTSVSRLEVVANPINILINRVDQRVSFVLTNLDSPVDNTFLYLTSSNNQFQFGNIQYTDNLGSIQTISPVNGLYHLGTIPYGSLNFFLETSYICNSGGNYPSNFTINYGYNCGAYPSLSGGVLTPAPCLLKQANISVNLAAAATDPLQYELLDGSIGCSSKTHRLKIRSLDLGNIYTNKVIITLPIGMSYKANTSNLSVLNSSAIYIYQNDIITDPIQLTSNVLEWDIESWNKWGQFDFTSGKDLILEFQTSVNCAYNRGNINTIVDQNTYCFEPNNKSLNYSIPGTTSICAPLTANVSGPSQICRGNEAVINYEVNNSLGNSDTYHLVWRINSTIIEEEDQTISSYPYNGSKTFNLDTYTNAIIQLTITNASGCSSNSNLVVTVNEIPTVTMNNLPEEFCLGTPPIGLIGFPIGGTFSGTGVSGNQYNPTTVGTHMITYTYTSPAGCTNTATDEIVADPCCPYRLNPVDVFCGTNQTYCLQLEAVRTVNDGIKGMDFVIRYNSAQVTPKLTSGIINATYGSVILNGLNSTQVDHSSSIQIPHASDSDPDKTATTRDLHVSIFYNSTAPSNADWNGIGNVICLEFEINAPAIVNLSPFKIGVIGIPPNHNNLFIGNTDEEYSLATVTQCVENGGVAPVTIIQNPTLTGVIRFHNTSDVLKYNAANPAQFNETFIQSTSDINSNCTPVNAANNTYPNLSGQFSVNMTGAAAVRFERDIDGDYYSPNCNTTSADVLAVMTAMNGYDSYLMESITTLRDPQSMTLTSDAGVPNPSTGPLDLTARRNTFPSPYQMIAADVNMNGRIRANDITWLQQRAVSQICEFPQAWNYAETGSSAIPITPVRKSYDWRFTNKIGERSTDYPYIGTTMSADKFDGYWRDAVPMVESCIEFEPGEGDECTLYAGTQEVYAVLLGDLDGSWRPNTSAQANLKVASNKAVVLDYANMTPIGNNTYRIPVAFNSDETTVSLDFVLNYDESKIGILSVGNLQEATDKNARVVSNDFNNSQLLFSSYTMSDYDPNADIFYVEVMSLTGEMKSSYLGSGAGFLNGKKVSLTFNGAATTPVIEDQTAAEYGFDVIPNPNNGTGSIHYNVKADANAKIVIYNAIGQIVREYTSINGDGAIELTSTELGAGMYQVILYKNANDKQVKKMVVYK
jgi:hypothetical protein